MNQPITTTGILDRLELKKTQLKTSLTEEMKENFAKLTKSELQDRFNGAILEDYKKYYADIKSEQEKQLDAFTKISEHLEKLNSKFSPNINRTTVQTDLDKINDKITEIKKSIENIPLFSS